MSDITRYVENSTLLDTCEISVPFAIRNTNNLTIPVELDSCSEEWFIHSTIEREIVCSDTDATCAFRDGHGN